MICENCGSSKQSKVINSRERKHFTMRKRKCVVCGYEYLTHEIFIRGDIPIDGARILTLHNLNTWREAVWVEYLHNDQCVLKATSIREVFPYSVSFDCQLVLPKVNYGNKWRVWSARPTEEQRKVEWK